MSNNYDCRSGLYSLSESHSDLGPLPLVESLKAYFECFNN